MRNRSRSIRVALLVPLLLLGSAWCMGEQKAQPKRLELGDPAPDLQVSVVKGDPVQLARDRGKVYIVEFWATWCGPCKYSIPHLTKLQEKYRDKGLVVVGISAETPPVVKPFVEKQGKGMNYTVAVDESRKTSRAYMEPFGVTGIPWAFVVDRDGLLVWTGHPMDPFMEELVGALLEENSSDSPAEKDTPAVLAPGKSAGDAKAP